MFIFNEKKVFADFADDQYIVLNHVNGEYYSFDKASSIALKALTEGCSPEELAQAFCSRYGGEACNASQYVERFVEQLISHGIIIPGGNIEGNAEQYVAAIDSEKMPELSCEVFTDVADLLTVDPIHEVDEEAGWPHKKS